MPNILWIITDDQPAHTMKKMPQTMERIVGRGVDFPRAYEAVPLCGPSRVTMLTSTYTHNNGCPTNSTHEMFKASGLVEDSVAVRLQNAGWTTGYFGKYMNGHAQEPAYVAPGWQRWVTTLSTVDKYVNVAGTPKYVTDHVDEFAALHLRNWLENRATETAPWFAVFAPTNPHTDGSRVDSHEASPGHSDDYDGVTWNPPALNEHDMSDKPTWLRGIAKQDEATMRRAYEGKLEELQDVDDQIASILNVLWNTGQLDDTYIFYVTDNGYLLGEHRLIKKEQPYEECVRTPFAVRGPGIAPGQKCWRLVSVLDLMPTALAIAGLDPDAGRELDGRSMLPHLTTSDWTGWRQYLLVEHPHREWALLCYEGQRFIDHYVAGEWEFYDIATDPDQMGSLNSTNVADHRLRLNSLRAATGLALRALERDDPLS